MNKSTLRNLAIVLFALIAILIGFELSDDETSVAGGAALFADLRDDINGIDRITIESHGREAVVLLGSSDGWTVPARDDFPANMAKIRELLIALADATVLEEKTANPDLYDRLGVRGPAVEGSRGVRITAAGAGATYSLILGDANQGSNRYVRIAEQAQSLLIDRNPALPDEIGGWLDNELIDVDMSDVRSVTITHADGETIAVEKAAQEDSGFDVPNIPEGRELSYPTVANSVAGALNDLVFEDVRRAVAAEPDVVTEFTTFDEQDYSVDVFQEDDATWIALQGESLAGHLAGQQFRVADFKANQLTRRWDDLLKTVEE